MNLIYECGDMAGLLERVAQGPVGSDNLLRPSAAQRAAAPAEVQAADGYAAGGVPAGKPSAGQKEEPFLCGLKQPARLLPFPRRRIPITGNC